MGRHIDFDKPLSQEDKDYLNRRGRGYMIAANERRFGVDGTKEPAPHEQVGTAASNQFYDSATRDRATYDQGGAPLPDSVLDYNTGRAYDRENGTELVEPTFGTPQPGQNANPSPFVNQEGFSEGADDDDADIDEDIANEVLDLDYNGLRSRLKNEGQDASGTKEELQDRLAIYLQDKRDADRVETPVQLPEHEEFAEPGEQINAPDPQATEEAGTNADSEPTTQE